MRHTCQHCKWITRTNKEEILLHEEECPDNPKMRGCPTCGNNVGHLERLPYEPHVCGPTNAACYEVACESYEEG